MLDKNKISEFEKDLQELKETHGVDPIATIEFPQYKILPDELVLALKIIEKHQYKIMLSYKENKNAN